MQLRKHGLVLAAALHTSSSEQYLLAYMQAANQLSHASKDLENKFCLLLTLTEALAACLD